MMSRETLTLGMSWTDVVVTLSEGNPGAATVLAQIIKDDPVAGIHLCLHLDDMNMRGPQIWVGFKDHCGQDIEKFKTAIVDRDYAMVVTINRECGGEEKAVISGGSSR